MYNSLAPNLGIKLFMENLATLYRIEKNKEKKNSTSKVDNKYRVISGILKDCKKYDDDLWVFLQNENIDFDFNNKLEDQIFYKKLIVPILEEINRSSEAPVSSRCSSV